MEVVSNLRSNVFQQIQSTQCESCSFLGNVKYDVFLHNIRIHRRCILCQEDYGTKAGIMDHLAAVHHEKTNCDICDFQVYPFERLKRHLILKHKICSKCGEQFETSLALEHHFELVHKDKKLADSLRHSFACEHCEFIGTKRALKVHTEREHNENSPEETEHVITMPSNVNGISIQLPIQNHCDRCNFTYKMKNELYIHNIRMHQRCIACQEDCFTKKRIMEHLMSIHGERVQCDLCDFQAYPYDRVAKHQILKHNVCSTCGQRFESPRALEEHTDIVHKKRDPMAENAGSSSFASCDYCDYHGSKNAVKLHLQRVHFGEYRYACDICDFKTYMKTKLEDHIDRRKKQARAMYFCEHCQFKSCTSYGLVFHRSKVHNATKMMKRYTCGYCWSKFTVMAHFKTHILSKHLGEEGRFACDICGFRTFDKCYLAKHVKKHEEQGGLFKNEITLPQPQAAMVNA